MVKVRRSHDQWMELDQADSRLDWSRQEHMDHRDKRMAGAPCHGKHNQDLPGCRVRNQHCVTYKCGVCQIRTLYVPAATATGGARKATPLEHVQQGPPMPPPQTRRTKAAAATSSSSAAAAKPTPRPTPAPAHQPRSKRKRHLNIFRSGNRTGVRAKRQHQPMVMRTMQKLQGSHPPVQMTLVYVIALVANGGAIGRTSANAGRASSTREKVGNHVLSDS